MNRPRTPVRVLVVDDHDLFRVGLSAALAGYEGIEVVGQASRGRMAVRLAEELRPDVILMDMRLPDLSGVAATEAILKKDKSARIIAFTVTSEESVIAAAIAAGVCGYVVKDAAIEDVVGAISAAVGGHAWLSPRAARAVLEQLRSRGTISSELAPATVALTPRQLEVLALMARGLDNPKIAAELSISPRTVKTHVSSILDKLGVSNRVEAAVYAARTGIV